MAGQGQTPMPIIKAYGIVKNPPHGWGMLRPAEAKAVGEVKKPEDGDGVQAGASR